MIKVEVNTGDRFGRLTIIQELPQHISPSGSKARKFLCKCDCGNTTEVWLTSLRRGTTKSCGCLVYETKNALDIKGGDVFGKLTVIKEVENYISPNGVKERRFLCKCECGNTKIVTRSYLKKKGVAPSCGCYSKVSYKKYHCKHNTYETNGETTKVFDAKGNYALIDTEDLEKVKPYYFYKTINGYFIASSRGASSKYTIYLHRLITNCPKDRVVDHINHCRNDNRKFNLKICSIQDNRKNQPFIGVVFLEHIKKWQVSAQKDNNIIYLGLCDTFDDAVELFKRGGA